MLSGKELSTALPVNVIILVLSAVAAAFFGTFASADNPH